MQEKTKLQWKQDAKWVNKLKIHGNVEILDEQKENFLY